MVIILMEYDNDYIWISHRRLLVSKVVQAFDLKSRQMMLGHTIQTHFVKNCAYKSYNDRVGGSNSITFILYNSHKLWLY